MTSLLVADGIKIIRGNRVIVDDFSSKLRSSDIVAMVGRNGAGKSTIMSALTGHLIPTEGKIHVLSDKKEENGDLSSSVAFVSQGRPLYSSITVEQHTRLARDINDSFNYQWAKEKIESLGISGKSKVSQLSGGQHTQVALIISLARNKKFMILDEPMADLDPVVKIWVRELLEQAAKEDGVGILVSSHTVSDLSAILTHLWVIEEGALLASVAREEIDSQKDGAFEEFVLEHLTRKGI